MTTPIEVTRGEMYDLLRMIKHQTRHVPKTFEIFENSLEAHLEALRCELLSARQSNDDLKTRNHALSYAYNALQVACRASGDSLREAQEVIRNQRQAIADLYMAKVKEQPAAKCQHSWRQMYSYPGGGQQYQCIFCAAFKGMV